MNNNILNRILIEWDNSENTDKETFISSNKIKKEMDIYSFRDSLFNEKDIDIVENECNNFWDSSDNLKDIFMLTEKGYYNSDITQILSRNNNKLHFMFDVWQQGLYKIMFINYTIMSLSLKRYKESWGKNFGIIAEELEEKYDEFYNIAREHINNLPNNGNITNESEDYYIMCCAGIYFYLINYIKTNYKLLDEWNDPNNKNYKFMIFYKNREDNKRDYIYISLVQGSIYSPDYPNEIIPMRLEIGFLYYK